MSLFVTIVTIFLALGTIKLVLFWIYLWQLKEYHVGRFIDHFRTSKGKRIIFSYFTQFFFWRFKKPVFTAKTILLITLLTIVLMTYWWLFGQNIVLLIIFNLLTPVIVSVIVLMIQPFFVLARNRILTKARKKMAQFPNVKVIGITGSYGKTSTKEFLTTILSSKFTVLSTKDHKNSEMGIAQTILQELNETHQIFIVEMGSYKKGGIKLLCDIVKPSIGMVTGVNEQHLATFGSLENLLSAEGGEELVKSLPKNGIIVLNADNKYCLDLYKKVYKLAGGELEKRIYTLQKNKIDSDMWTEDITVQKDHISFIARSKEKEMAHFMVSVLGKHNIQNLLGAVLVAKELQMTFGEISQAVKKIEPKQAGITLAKGTYGINIIDSSYSSNPDGVVADLDYLTVFPNKKVIVMPCLIELGQKSIAVHIQLGEKIAKTCDLAIITTKDKFKEIKIGAMAAGMKETQILLIDKPKEILHHITTFCSEEDAVLLEGRVPGELIKLLHGK